MPMAGNGCGTFLSEKGRSSVATALATPAELIARDSVVSQMLQGSRRFSFEH